MRENTTKIRSIIKQYLRGCGPVQCAVHHRKLLYRPCRPRYGKRPYIKSCKTPKEDILQEEVTRKTVALAIKAAKLDARTAAKGPCEKVLQQYQKTQRCAPSWETDAKTAHAPKIRAFPISKSQTGISKRFPKPPRNTGSTLR